MASTIQKEQVGGVAYDREEVRVRLKKYNLMFIGWEEIVRADTIKNELVLELTSPRMPDKILFNGKEVVISDKK